MGISAQSLRIITALVPLQLSSTAWALATLELAHRPLRTSIAAEALRKITEFDVTNSARTAWALAELRYRDYPLRDAIAAKSLRPLTANAEMLLESGMLAFIISFLH